jgi:hypothetical protein
VVEGYEQALATGGYSAACHFLAPQTRERLARDGGASNCAAAVTRCLPNNAIVPKKDQSQLLYATVVTSGHGSGTKVSISGNPVANAIRNVSLKPKPGGWILTSYGEGFTGCQPGTKKNHSQGKTRGRRHH